MRNYAFKEFLNGDEFDYQGHHVKGDDINVMCKTI